MLSVCVMCVWGPSLSEWMASVLIRALPALIWKEGSDWAYPRHTCRCDSCDSCQAQGPQTNTNYTAAYLQNSHHSLQGIIVKAHWMSKVMSHDYFAWWCWLYESSLFKWGLDMNQLVFLAMIHYINSSVFPRYVIRTNISIQRRCQNSKTWWYMF